MATNDELLRIWAQQNGSDYNVLAGSQNGGSTGSSQNAANDLYSQYGWNDGTLPGTSTPTATQTNQTTTVSTQQPTATNPYPYMQDYIDYYTAIGQQPDKSYDEWVSWRNGGGTQQTTTPTGTGGTTTAPTTTTGGTSTTGGGTSVQDYINYYKSLGQTTPDKDYDTWVAWMQGGSSPTTPTNPGTTTGGTTTGGTTETTTGGTTPTQTTGTSPQDYINYYTSRGITQPPIGYEAWVQMMQGGGDTTPTGGDTSGTTGGQTGTGTGTTGGQTQGTSVQDYITYWTSRGVTTPPMGYDEWVTFITNGGGTTTPGATGTGGAGTGGEQSGTGSSTVDAMTEWQQIMARVNAGQGTIADYYRLQELAGILSGGGAGTGGGGTGIGGIGGTGGAGTGTGAAFHEYPTVNPDREQAIRNMYDAQINAERAALQEQGDQALSDAQANRDNIAKLYNQQRNAASVEWERQRRNFLEGAAISGLNTGAGSQAELSMMSTAQREQNNLGAAQAGAEAEADRNMADIRRSTQAAINEAVMKNDYQKAAALLDEYNEQYNRAMDRAEALAQYGDFSGYAALYGNEAAAQMRQTWVMSNPEIALALGLISQQQYAALALYKQYPALALSGGSGGGSGDGGGYNPVSSIANVFNNHSDEIIQGIIDREMSVISGATNNG